MNQLKRLNPNINHRDVMAFGHFYNKVGILILITGLTMPLQSAVAQEKHLAEKEEFSLKGIVIDATNGTGMSGVVVKIAELNVKTKTNEEGEFSFTNIVARNPAEVTLNANHKGFKELSKTINLQKPKKITLELNTKPHIE